MSKLTTKQAEQQEALTELRSVLKPGDTVYTVLRKVSADGMSRQISLFVVRDGEMYRLSHTVAKALGYTLTDKNPGGNWAIRIGGAGMDMGFHLVYTLGRALFQTPEDSAKGYDHGYQLNQRWL